MRYGTLLCARITKAPFSWLRTARHQVVGVLGTLTFGFFVKDRVASGEVKIEYCPTQEMMADYFTKPLQGATFSKMRDAIMNSNPQCLNYAHEDCRSVLNVSDGRSGET